MFRIGTIVQSNYAQQAKRLLPADLSACPAAGSIRMKMQLTMTIELHSDSADTLSDSNLYFQSQLTPCED
jgi:hypothetical protein